jgi:hypothetical protein
VLETTFDDHGTTILTEHLLVGNHVHCMDEIGEVKDTFLGKREC